MYVTGIILKDPSNLPKHPELAGRNDDSHCGAHLQDSRPSRKVLGIDHVFLIHTFRGINLVNAGSTCHCFLVRPPWYLELLGAWVAQGTIGISHDWDVTSTS